MEEEKKAPAMNVVAKNYHKQKKFDKTDFDNKSRELVEKFSSKFVELGIMEDDDKHS